MTCPFLKEAQLRYCQTASIRKMIPSMQAGRAEEKCSSDGYASCPLYQAQPADGATSACPYLRESLMQYCGASPVAKFVPYSESLLSRCGNDGFRYCELYLAMAHPEQAGRDTGDLTIPDWLLYSPNHMWLDLTEDGSCHIGMDAFLSRALGKVDRVSYVWTKGRHRPIAVLTLGGVELELVFPNSMMITNCNLYLRADPSKLASEPYTGGWLFEGKPEPETARNLLTASAASTWMETEQRRMNEFLQQLSPGPVGPAAADGGLFARGVAHQLERERMRAMFHDFFSPMSEWE